MSSAPKTQVGNGNSKENISRTNTRESKSLTFFILFTKAGTLSLKCGYFYLRTHYKPGFILILRDEIILPSRLSISHIL